MLPKGFLLAAHKSRGTLLRYRTGRGQAHAYVLLTWQATDDDGRNKQKARRARKSELGARVASSW